MDYPHLRRPSHRAPVNSLSESHSLPPSASTPASSHLSQHGYRLHGASSSQIPTSSDRHNPFHELSLHHTLAQGQAYGQTVGSGHKKQRLAPSLSAHPTHSSDDPSVGSHGSSGYAFHSPQGGGVESREDIRPNFRPGGGTLGGGAAPGRGGFSASAQYNTNFFSGTPPSSTGGNFIPGGYDNFPTRPPATSTSQPASGALRPRGGNDISSLDVYHRIMGSSPPQGPGSQAGSGSGAGLFNLGSGNSGVGDAFGLDWPVHGTG